MLNCAQSWSRSCRRRRMQKKWPRGGIVIYGAGNTSYLYETTFQAEGIDPVCFIDNAPSKHGTVFHGKPVINIEEARELQPEWFAGVGSVGVCGATSTPEWLMREVADAIAAMGK